MDRKPSVKEAGNYPFPVAYYGLANDLDFDDKRLPEMIKDRQEKGFDETELWNLDLTMMKFILPRLVALRESEADLIENTGEDSSRAQWTKKVDKVIAGFKIAVEEQDYYSNDKNIAIIQEAINTLAEVWLSLWN